MFNTKVTDISKISSATDTDCLVLGIYENGVLSQIAEKLVQKNELIDAYKTGDINGKAGSALLLRQPKKSKIKRILLVGLGKNQKITEKDFSNICKTIVTKFSSISVKDAVLALPFNQIQNRNTAWAIKKYIAVSYEQSYKSDALKSNKENTDKQKPKTITFTVPKSYSKAAKQDINQGKIIAESVKFTKDIANLPGNICTPTFLADKAKELAKDNRKISVNILNEKQIAALKMGSFLSVSRGSEEPPKFIILKYQGTNVKQKPIVLVGKGLTFDSGGISLKPGKGMDEMKYDMCGAASVLGTMKAVCELNLKLNVIGLIPSCENLPSGRANKPGDIVTSMSGMTIEILNTDAEGRLILCDALTYAERFKPELVIDIATLTGACIVALGNHNSGLFTRHDAAHDNLADALIRAGKNSSDTVWRLPIEDSYQEQLKSNFADVANIGGSFGGSITAACFLERFTRKYIWAHLDIAGTAWKSGGTKGATGRPVPLLTEFLVELVGKK